MSLIRSVFAVLAVGSLVACTTSYPIAKRELGHLHGMSPLTPREVRVAQGRLLRVDPETTLGLVLRAPDETIEGRYLRITVDDSDFTAESKAGPVTIAMDRVVRGEVTRFSIARTVIAAAAPVAALGATLYLLGMRDENAYQSLGPDDPAARFSELSNSAATKKRWGMVIGIPGLIALVAGTGWGIAHE